MCEWWMPLAGGLEWMNCRELDTADPPLRAEGNFLPPAPGKSPSVSPDKSGLFTLPSDAQAYAESSTFSKGARYLVLLQGYPIAGKAGFR